KQLMMSGKDFLFRNDPEYQGFIDSLDFKVGGVSLQWSYDAKHIDIAKLTLTGRKGGDFYAISGEIAFG
ncbi:MAG: hypothetical protein RI977_1052, partial [Bacteroidota bacterium]